VLLEVLQPLEVPEVLMVLLLPVLPRALVVLVVLLLPVLPEVLAHLVGLKHPVLLVVLEVLLLLVLL
jgi:hypothetical protein